MARLRDQRRHDDSLDEEDFGELVSFANRDPDRVRAERRATGEMLGSYRGLIIACTATCLTLALVGWRWGTWLKGQADDISRAGQMVTDANERQLRQHPLVPMLEGDASDQTIVAAIRATPSIARLPIERAKKSPLHLAAEKDRVEVVAALLDAGAKIDLRDAARRTPLELAVQRKAERTARLLVDRGADLTPEAETGGVMDLEAMAKSRKMLDLARYIESAKLRRGR